MSDSWLTCINGSCLVTILCGIFLQYLLIMTLKYGILRQKRWVCMQSRNSARPSCFHTGSVCHAQLNHSLHCCNKDEYRHFCHIFKRSPLNTVCHVLWCMIRPANSVMRPCPPHVKNIIYRFYTINLSQVFKLCIWKYCQPCQENVCLTRLTFCMRNINFCHLTAAYARLNLGYVNLLCISL